MDATTKKCPMCAEQIPLEATVCEFCGAKFEVTVEAGQPVSKMLEQPNAPPTPPAQSTPTPTPVAASKKPIPLGWVSAALGLILILVLVGGGVLIAQNGLPFLATPTNTPQPTVTPRPVNTATPEESRVSIGELVGTWHGTARNGETDFVVHIGILPSCQIGEVCGWFNLPDFSCGGIFRLVYTIGNTFQFEASNKTSACGVGQDYLQPQSDGTLRYFSKGDYGEESGILNRTSEAHIYVFTGNWSGAGSGRNPQGGEYSFQRNITIWDSCQIGKECGTWEIPDFSCSGTFVLDDVIGDTLKLHSTNSGGCEGVGADYLQLQSNGTLLHFSKGTWGADITFLERR